MSLQFFHDGEFQCKCGSCPMGIAHMDPRLLHILDDVRRTLDKPLRINSAVRCSAHNARVGGSQSSEHVPQNTDTGLCTAVDIHIPHSQFLFSLLPLLYAHGVPRLGLNQEKRFLHVGLSKNHAQQVFFDY